MPYINSTNIIKTIKINSYSFLSEDTNKQTNKQNKIQQNKEWINVY